MDSFEPRCLMSDEALKPRADMRLGYMDIVLFGDS
jgi:hypothetical protein